MLKRNLYTVVRGDAVAAVGQGWEQSRHDIFVGRSEADKATADAACAALAARRVRCWIVPRDTAIVVLKPLGRAAN